MLKTLVGGGKDDGSARFMGICNPSLAAIKNVLVPMQYCSGGGSAGVAPVPGLRQSKATDLGTGGIGGQPREGGREGGLEGGKEGGREGGGEGLDLPLLLLCICSEGLDGAAVEGIVHTGDDLSEGRREG